MPLESWGPKGQIKIKMDMKNRSQMVRHPFRREENIGKRWRMSPFDPLGASRIVRESVRSEMDSKLQAIQVTMRMIQTEILTNDCIHLHGLEYQASD